MKEIQNNLVSVFVKDLDNQLFVTSKQNGFHVLDFLDIDAQINKVNKNKYTASGKSHNYSEPAYEHLCHGDIIVIIYKIGSPDSIVFIYIPEKIDEAQEKIIKDCLNIFEGYEVNILQLKDDVYCNVEVDTYGQANDKYKTKTLQITDTKIKK